MSFSEILVINPGSTSTKIAVYRNEKVIFLKSIRHDVEELSKFERVTDQYSFRKAIIMEELKETDTVMDLIEVVIGRGGLIKPVKSGVYEVNDKLKHDLLHSYAGEHASNLGGLIADDIAGSLPKAKAYIADPVVVDELQDIARISGHPLFKRNSIFHALNQKATGAYHAKLCKTNYKEMNLIIAHLGGGISIGAHKKGKVIDVNQGLDGEGPFAPERSGTLPTGDLVRLCYSGKYKEEDVLKMVTGEGGMVAYLGTNNAYEIEQKVLKGEKKASLIFRAMAYQVAKYIGAMSVVMQGEVDAILLTGGVAYSEWFVNEITEQVQFIAPVHVYPGEDEMEALAMNGLKILKGKAEIHQYQ